MLSRILFAGAIIALPIRLLLGDGNGLGIIFDFAEKVIEEVDIKEILQEDVFAEYPYVCLLDYTQEESVLIRPDTGKKLWEINVTVAQYPKEFKESIANIFNYFVKWKYDVILNFWTTLPKREKILHGCLSWQSNGSLELKWNRGLSGTAVENIIFIIILGNYSIYSFTYASTQEAPSTRDMLRWTLTFLKESSEYYIKRFIRQKALPPLRVLRLPNHSEISAEKLIELLETSRIEVLDISQWKLTEKELEKLFECLMGYPSLKKLCIAGNRIHEKALKNLGYLVACNINLEELDMGFLENKLTVASIKEFINGVNEINPTLKKISFGNTEITETEWEDFVINPLRERLPNCQIIVCLASE